MAFPVGNSSPAGSMELITNFDTDNSAEIGNTTNNATVTVPVADFSSTVNKGYIPLVQLNDSSQNATAWNWDFGDGTNSTIQNPVHTFSKPGLYTVTLTASNAGGSSTTTISKYIKVK